MTPILFGLIGLFLALWLRKTKWRRWAVYAGIGVAALPWFAYAIVLGWIALAFGGAA